VQSTAGVPVARATVFAYIAQAGDCGRRDAPDGLDETRADGTYTVGIAGAEETESTCVRVRVRAPPGSDFPDAPDTTITLAIRLTPPFDSARVDVTLGPP
jgi:hypothetical protein